MSIDALMLPVSFGTISSLGEEVGHAGRGTYLLTQSRECTGPSGQPRLHLTLEDATGAIDAVVWPEYRAYVQALQCPSPVLVSGQIGTFAGEIQLRVHCLAAREPSEAGLATALLPGYRCSAEAIPAFARLSRLEAELPFPLDGFLGRVLLDPDIGVPFLSCRASVKHHHAYVGGLLVHSTEMLDRVADIARHVLPDDPWAPSIGQVTYLLHDVGKLRSVGERARTCYGLVVDHEIMSFELLAPHLRWLEGRSPELAAALRAVLAYLATPSRSRGPSPYAVADIVAKMDQWSAATHNQRDMGNLLRLGRPMGVATHVGSREPDMRVRSNSTFG